MQRIHALILVAISCSIAAQAETVRVGDRQFTIPDGYELKLACRPGLTERPIVVDFDHRGHLYVAESSGTNDNVQKQLAEKPHSILCLTDSDGDGQFDKRTVFADRMMFPEGILCHQDSVYVSAPPQIWKLTDSDDDGVADKREVWLDAKTLTGCANDLHGPYLGLDGWIYWCKGAFAEQTYECHGGQSLVTRASHIFRRRPEGGLVEPVMTGGMDNPVEVAFTSAGERIFTTTFFQHPANGQRDGLVHAIYGGVYGKRHGVIEGHARTGDLMPVLTHLGAAAPSGLARLESNSLGFRNQLVTACFNLHSVTRHELVPQGATFKTRDSDLVSSNDLDFHPTDVIEDVDGSLLIVDTGGWYKLCCPTSQLHKPDVSGAIYRLSKIQDSPSHDSRGEHFEWEKLAAKQLANLLDDEQFAVRQRATSQLANIGSDSIPAIRHILTESSSSRARLNAVWTACRIDSPKARATVRIGLRDRDPEVRQAAAHAVSVWRDADAANSLLKLLDDKSPAIQRTAAEALGRLGSPVAVPRLLDKLGADADRVLEHSLIYALIEINAADEVRKGFTSGNAKQKRCALLAIHGMRDGHLTRDELSEFLMTAEPEIRSVATDIATEHPEWSEKYVQLFREQLAQDSDTLPQLCEQIGRLGEQPAIVSFIGELLESDSTTTELKVLLLGAVATSNGRIDRSLDRFLSSNDQALLTAAVRSLGKRKKGEMSQALSSRLALVAKSPETDHETRLLAAKRLRELDDKLFADVITFLSQEQPARIRSLAVTVLEDTEITKPQLPILADELRSVGPLELSRLLQLFERETDEKLGTRLFESLADSPAASNLPAEQIVRLMSQFGDETARLAKPLLATASIDPLEKAEQLQELLDSLPTGDIRRGQETFHSEKLACFTCHAIGYRGGTIGPDLSRIGKTRSRRDLLEAIVHPNASFVRSYEPVSVLTLSGQQLMGVIRDQSTKEIELQLNATESKKIRLDEIEEVLPGKVSIMPAGLDKQLSNEQLADLLAFLESRK